MTGESPGPPPFWIKHLALGLVSGFVVFGFARQVLRARQVKAEQRDSARMHLDSTRSQTGVTASQARRKD